MSESLIATLKNHFSRTDHAATGAYTFFGGISLDLVEDAIDTLSVQIILARCGLDDFSPLERLAIELLFQEAGLAERVQDAVDPVPYTNPQGTPAQRELDAIYTPLATRIRDLPHVQRLLQAREIKE